MTRKELREAVCGLIDWEGIGFRLLGSAGNGLDALQMVEQLQPDLLLTDIHMPFISGTSLARQVRELQPLIQIAFLSGYDDFEYARAAIDCDVIAYLLKPISMEELTKALRDIHEKLEAKFSDFAGGGDGPGPCGWRRPPCCWTAAPGSRARSGCGRAWRSWAWWPRRPTS